jgi:hypothetical protein
MLEVHLPHVVVVYTCSFAIELSWIECSTIAFRHPTFWLWWVVLAGKRFKNFLDP